MLSVVPAMCNEVEVFEEADEVFFDSFECLSLEEHVLEKRGEFGYDVWLNGLHSVKERRQKFLRRMGSSEFKLTSDSEAEASNERIRDYSRAVCSSSSPPSSSSLSIVGGDEGVMCDGGGDCRTDDSNCLVDDLSGNVPTVKAKKGRWWKPILPKMRTSHSDVSKRPSPSCKAGKGTELNVHAVRKGFLELTALYAGQEITGHTGMIRTMKFSHDGQYLASGGEDGVVRVWCVELVLASDFFGSELGRSKKFSHSSVEIPEKVFQIKESPMHEFHGHTSGVLDLSWSSATNCLLSSSKDNTVRLWKVGSDECLGVFHHNNYVTCVQFNPADDNLFISGCIDGKVRVWQVTEKRVADWADVHDIVSAISYQPNGKGFIAGSISGVCRFYEIGNELSLDGEVQLGGKRRSYRNIITGIQFLPNDPQKVMITSGDSKIRILDGREVVCKYRGLAKSASQMSAAYTPTGKHLISVGEDSRIYLWNQGGRSFQESKQVKSERSFEHFISESASIAIPWLGHSATTQMTPPRIRDSERFSLGNWFSIDISTRGCSVTWPEEVLPHPRQLKNSGIPSPAWGLVIVTAGWDGKIRTFHNYGLPVRI